jgi:hypothetical protein
VIDEEVNKIVQEDGGYLIYDDVGAMSGLNYAGGISGGAAGGYFRLRVDVRTVFRQLR